MRLRGILRAAVTVACCCMLVDGVVACLWKSSIDWWSSASNGITTTELPLGSVNGIAVDADGRVYIGSEAYYRVQVYSQDGRFLHGIDVGRATAHGAFHFRIADSGHLEVYGVRTKTISCYGQDGLVAGPRGEPMVGWRNVRQVTRSDGQSTLRLGKWSWLWPSVIEVDAAGRTRTVAQQTSWIWLLRLPAPAMGFVVIGFFGTCWGLRLRIIVNGRARG